MPQAIASWLLTKLAISAASFLGTLITAAVHVAVAIGLNTLVNAVFGRSGSKPSDGQQNIRVAVGSRRRHYGIVHTGGQESFLESANGTLAKVVTLGTGKEGEVLEDRINDRPVTVVNGTVTEPSYHGAIHIYRRDGDDNQSAIAELTAKFPQWTPNHRQRGCAHAAIICDPVKQEHFSEVFNGQIPVYTQVRKAVSVYDPRKDSTAVIYDDGQGFTVNGTGPHRLSDRSTWEWSDNWALVTADYFAHEDGYGAGYGNVNWANIAVEADRSDELVTTVTAETIARWRIWASYSLASEERRQVLSDMLKAGDGFCWQDANGKFNLLSGRYEQPTVVITDDHILGMTATLGPQARHRVSAIKALYTEAAIGYREQESATVVAPDAEDDPNTDPQAIEVFFAPHHNQAVRIGKLILARLGDRWHISAQLNLFGLNLLGERFCRLESEQLGVWADFMVADGVRLNLGARTVEVTLDEIVAGDWVFDAATEEGTPPLAPDAPAPPPPLAAPTGLALAAVQIALGGATGVAIEASWADPGRVGLAYEAQYQPTAGGTWVSIPVDPDARTARTGPVDSGTEYELRVRAMSIGGRASAWSSSTITPVAETTLGAPTGLAATGGVGEATVTFRMPTSPNLAYARLYGSSSNDFGTAAPVGDDIVAGLGDVVEVTDTGLSAGTKYYWARAFDGQGGSSALVGPASATIS